VCIDRAGHGVTSAAGEVAVARQVSRWGVAKR
jgi:hypothetical protein